MENQNAWRELVSEVAHDLKTPITSARGFVELMKACGDPLSERQERYASVALEALEQMEQLVARLLEASWIEEGRPLRPAPLDLDRLILHSVEATRAYAERHQVALEVDLDTALGSINADERRLEQAILNLLSNAVKYNKPQGHVWVTACGTAREVVLTVRDDGRGIAPVDLPYIFDRFYRAPGAKVEGTGLGLSIVKTLVDLHGGQVNVESEVGVGTTFTITLPRAGHSPAHHDSERELISTADEGAESLDTTQAENADELLDSVDDNLQEPPQMFNDTDDTDAPDVADAAQQN